MELIGYLLMGYLIFGGIINLCTRKKLNKLDGEERKKFITKRRIITIVVVVVFCIFSAIMTNLANPK